MAELMSVGWPESRSEASVARALTTPSADPERNMRVAVDSAGAIVGTARLDEVGRGQGKFWLDVRATSPDVADTLAGWAEGRCSEWAGGPARLFAGAWSAAAAVLRPLEARGFRPVRRSLRMTVDLADAIPVPDWPHGIVVRTLEAEDGRAVYDVHMETFRDSWEHEPVSYEDWAHWHLDRERYDPALSFLACDGAELAAIALCREDDASPGLGWVSILGVRRPWRRRGLAAALLQHAFRAFSERGCRRVVLGVDATSVTGAERLYERVGMTVADRFETYEKSL